MAPRSTYNQKYHDDWAWSLAMKGGIDQEIADAFGVSIRTINRWKKDHPSFAEALEAGKSAADAKVERCLFERATGYEAVEDKESVMEVDKDGNTKPLRVKTVKKRVLPDTMAIMYWLNNRRRSEWSQRQDVSIETTSSVDLSNLTDEELRELARLAEQEEDSG